MASCGLSTGIHHRVGDFSWYSRQDEQLSKFTHRFVRNVPLRALIAAVPRATQHWPRCGGGMLDGWEGSYGNASLAADHKSPWSRCCPALMPHALKAAKVENRGGFERKHQQLSRREWIIRNQYSCFCIVKFYLHAIWVPNAHKI